MRCNNCGNEVTTSGPNCPFCGFPLMGQPGGTGPQATGGYQQQYGQNTNMGGEQQWDQRYNTGNSSNSSLDPKSAAVICYITWIGFIVALIASDQNDPFLKHHLNNALILIIAAFVLGFVCIIPLLGWIIALVGEIFLLVCWIIGLVGAINGEYKQLPILGDLKILK